MKNRTDFVYAAIQDTQATIRAIDVKVGILLVGLLAPFSNLGRIVAHTSHLVSTTDFIIGYGLSITFFALWALALTSLVMSVSAIDNPAAHIASSSKFKGAFYGGGLYRLSIIDALLNRDTVKAEMDFASFSKAIPTSDNETEEELIFEHMKLIYIREIKLVRLKFSYRFAICWFIFGLIIYGASKSA